MKYLFSILVETVFTAQKGSDKRKHVFFVKASSASMDDELGKARPCYGEFRCPICHRQWKSTKAWADYGQNCQVCDTLVRPVALSKTFVYICTDCPATWQSRYSRSGLPCKNCHSFARIIPLDPDNSDDRITIQAHKRQVGESDNVPNPNGKHDEQSCEKCRISGRPCRETAVNPLRTATALRKSYYENELETIVSIHL